ncbi:MAG: hypothetical protein IPP71_02925 [Bacteroidetes bacterium]|nr:hypothetical protein [Bacteroidota bacterium]
MLICVSVFAQNSSDTQQKNKKYSISIYGGMALPTGKFSEYQTIDPSQQGIAQGFNNYNIAGAPDNGYLFGLSINCNLKNNFEIGLNAERFSMKALRVSYPAMYYPENVRDGGTILYESGNWNVTNIFLAPAYMLSMRKLELVVLVKAGLQVATSPESQLIYELYFNNSNYKPQFSMSQPKLNNLALGYGGGLEGRYAVNKKIKIILNGNFQQHTTHLFLDLNLNLNRC